jgi:hypothetical protein
MSKTAKTAAATAVAILTTPAQAIAHAEQARKGERMHATPPTRAAVPMPDSKVSKVVTIGLVGQSNTDTKKANDSAAKALGTALADVLIADIERDDVRGKPWLVKIAELSHPGRVAFRSKLDAFWKGWTDEARQWKDTEQHALYVARNKAKAPRVSEARKFSEAIDAGYPFDPDMGYTETIAAARCFLQAEASMTPEGVTPVSPTRRRGRPATPTREKAKNYLEKLDLSPKDWNTLAEFCLTLAKGE